MSTQRWDGLAAYAGATLSHPALEEERARKLALAQGLCEAIALASEGGRWEDAATRALSTAVEARRALDTTVAGLPPSVAHPRHLEVFEKLVSTRSEALGSALAAFGGTAVDPERRFALFAEIAERSPDPPPSTTVVGLGSLFNFAVEPTSLPAVRPQMFARLEELLDFGVPSGSAVEQYAHHLRFADEVRRRLDAAGVQVRDMMDVQHLVHAAPGHQQLWSSGLTAELAPIPHVQPAHTETTPGEPAYLAVGALYLDQAPYLREWIEFHRLVGVERFFLYDNASTDAHLEVLAPYLADGTVVVRDWPERPVQARVYSDLVETHRDDARWIAVIDLDEFLFSPTGKPVSEVLRAFEVFPGVVANLVNFGTGGHREKPPGLVIESYTYRTFNPEGERTVKSIFDPRRVIRCENAHAFAYESGSAVDELLRPVPVPDTRTETASCSLLRINHYPTRSETEVRLKWMQPNPNAGEVRKPRPVPQGELRDDLITAYVPALKRAIAERGRTGAAVR
jgi:hypothetical protein